MLVSRRLLNSLSWRYCAGYQGSGQRGRLLRAVLFDLELCRLCGTVAGVVPDAAESAGQRLCVGLPLFYRLEHVEQRMIQELEAKRRQGGKAAIQA